MYKIVILVLTVVSSVWSLPSQFSTETFRVGIEYEHSLPMIAGSDRYRHKNNYDPFFVTITATAKNGYVLDFLEVTATTDASGEVDFCLIRGKVGSKTMVFQLSSNQSDFLSYRYTAYGIKEDEYIKISNTLIIPVPGKSSHLTVSPLFVLTIILISITNSLY